MSESKVLTAEQVETQRDAYDWPAFELEILDSHEALRAELAKVTKECDEFDSRATRVRVALDQAGIAGVETYPNEDVNHYTKCLRAGGRVVPDDERVRRLTKERDEERERGVQFRREERIASHKAAREHGAAEERARIVAWLKAHPNGLAELWGKDIERGEHAKEPTTCDDCGRSRPVPADTFVCRYCLGTNAKEPT